MNNQSSAVQMRGYNKVEAKVDVDPLTKTFGKKALGGEQEEIKKEEESKSSFSPGGSSASSKKKKRRSKEEQEKVKSMQVMHQRVFLRK